MALTSKRKEKIKIIVGKCEYPGCNVRDIDLLDIHHIDDNNDNDIESNILVLCKKHHTHGAVSAQYSMSKSMLRELIKKRSNPKRKAIRDTIRDAKKRQKARSKTKSTNKGINKTSKRVSNNKKSKGRKKMVNQPYGTESILKGIDRDTRKFFGGR